MKHAAARHPTRTVEALSRRQGSHRTVAQMSTALLLLVAFDVTSGLQHLLAARLVALVLALTLPGATLMGAFRVRFRSGFVQWTAIFGLSAATLMAWGVAGSMVMPHLGVNRPLERMPVLLAINFVTLVATVVAGRDSDPVLDFVPGCGHIRPKHVAFAVLCAVGPMAALAGVEHLNGGGSNIGVQISFAISALVLVVGAWLAFHDDMPTAQACLFSAGLAMVWIFSFRGSHLFGYDIQQEFQRFEVVFGAGRWSPPTNGDPYASMLSITALPAMLAHLTGISGLYLFKGVFPIFLAFVPGLVVHVAGRWSRLGPAYLAGTYLVVLPQFTGQLPGISRQEVGFFFFGLLLVLLVDEDLIGATRQIAIVIDFAALVVSHYSTSYVAVLVLTLTWLAYGAIRLFGVMKGRKTSQRRRRRRFVPIVSLVTVLSGIGMVFAWDVGITHSTSNVTHFASEVIDKGPDFLPNATGGNILTRWLNGNVGSSQTPSEYYTTASNAAKTQRWLNPYPRSITSQFPAQSAPQSQSNAGIDPSSSGTITTLATTVTEIFLVFVVAGAALLLVRRFRREAPSEIAIFGVAFLLFVGYTRISGSVAGSYNIDRAEFQSFMFLSIGLAFTIDFLVRHLRWIAITGLVVALAVLFATNTGESSVVSGGAPVSLFNFGPGYDQFVISDEEAAAAAWLIHSSGSNPLIYTDEYGTLRIWDATTYAAAPQTLLTPATIDQGSWVLATQYNVQGRAYGSSGGQVSYRFPRAFLNTVKDVVYSSPQSRVYR
jgi:uncharacterized membrane protein